ncbi:hypothetical protein [Kordia sp.]|uniref:hypothetical protein n=1 Tax=Kordia sp. TaxID=1965332 RepID=UPI003D6BC425
MKKRNLKLLQLSKKTISNLKINDYKGGREVSIHETNCDHCPVGTSPDDGGGDGDGGGGGTRTCTTFRTIISCVIC